MSGILTNGMHCKSLYCDAVMWRCALSNVLHVVHLLILDFLFCKAYWIIKNRIMNVYDLVYVLLHFGISQRANIWNVNSRVVKDYVESKK